MPMMPKQRQPIDPKTLVQVYRRDAATKRMLAEAADGEASVGLVRAAEQMEQKAHKVAGDSQRVPTVIEEYGLEASDHWVRLDVGTLLMTSAEVSEACRMLTKTMLSVRHLREGEEAHGTYNFVPTAIPTLLERLAREEDRSVTWPGYPERAGRLKVLGRK